MNRIFFILILLVVFQKAKAQNYSFGQLFYPNLTLTARQYQSVDNKTIRDNDNYFQHSRSGGSAIVPLRSEVQLGIGFRKKLDFKAIHTVAIGQFTNNNSTIQYNLPKQFKTVSLSVIQLQASIRDRLWIYGGGVGFTEEKETFLNPTPFVWGGAARMHVLGLNSQILYGSAVIFNQKLRMVPVFGVNQKLGKKWRIEGILPFQLSVSHKLQKWLTAEAQANLRGYSGGYKVEVNQVNVGLKQNLSQVDLGLSLNAHLIKLFNIGIEGGYAYRNKLLNFDNLNKPTAVLYNPANGFYVGANLRYLTSKSKLSSKFLNKVGIGL